MVKLLNHEGSLKANETHENSSELSQVKASVKVSGKVTNRSGDPLAGATVVEVGTNNGAISDVNGLFSLEVASFPVTIRTSYVGYSDQKMVVSSDALITVVLTSEESFNEVIVTGTRALGRTKVDAPVPVDVIDIASVTSKGGQVSVTEIMNVLAPSFTSQSQTVSDGSDHIDPASLRGLGPDQVLVLINGKRRHNTSLLNVNGTVGAGSVGTDMNAIPAAAICAVSVVGNVKCV